MKYAFAALFVVIVLVGCAPAPADHAHDQSAEMPMEHTHALYEVAAADAPTVSVTVEHDDVSGYNVHVETTNFKWDPAHVNEADAMGTGHAHLYVDGVKIARMYGPDYHISSMAQGTRTVRVELNTNTHKPYAVAGDPVDAEVQVVVDHMH